MELLTPWLPVRNLLASSRLLSINNTLFSFNAALHT
jgi:hypothetical protein